MARKKNARNIITPLILHEYPNLELIQEKYKNDIYGFKIVSKIHINIYHRTIVSEQQNHRCCYCGIKTTEIQNKKQSATVDHIIPRSKGGLDEIDNYVMACLACNTHRGAMPAEEFFYLVSNGYNTHQGQGKQKHIKKQRLSVAYCKTSVCKQLKISLVNPFEIDTKEWKKFNKYLKSPYLDDIINDRPIIEHKRRKRVEVASV